MRALSRNTRRVTALTLAAALVIAVYLNWQYARTDTGIAADEEAQVVSAEPVQSDTVQQQVPGRPAHGSRNSVGREQKLRGSTAGQRGKRQRRKVL